jgi:predicted DNA-binding WGR domain protein
MRRWVHREKARYYQAELTEDLLGGWCVVTAWGGTHSRLGQIRRAWLPSNTEALKQLDVIDKRRRRRGYHPIATD